jgi:hypothetical protein
MAARAAVEALLRERKLDRTLTSTLPERLGEDAVAPLDQPALDQILAGRDGPQSKAAGGGLPRGQVSEVVGPASSGRTSVAWAALAAASRRGESIALIDTFDRFDPPTAQACGIVLSKLLWVRGHAVSKVNGPGTFVERVIDRAIKALNLVVSSGVCTLVVIDLIDVPSPALRRLPASTWFRVERAIEGSDTAVLILAAQPIARSAGGRSITLTGSREPGTGNREPGTGSREPGTGNRTSAFTDPGSRIPVPAVIWNGDHDRTRRIGGVRLRANVTAARSSQTRSVDLSTTVLNAV